MPDLCPLNCNQPKDDDRGHGIVCATHADVFHARMQNGSCGACGDPLSAGAWYFCGPCRATMNLATTANAARGETN